MFPSLATALQVVSYAIFLAMSSTTTDKNQPSDPNINKGSVDMLQLSARSASKEMSEGRITAEELMIATLDRIEKLNPKYKAIHSLRSRSELINEAKRCDQQNNKLSNQGKLCGIPIAIKDLSNAAGLPTTMGGSPLHYFNYPSESDLFVQRIQEEGAIVIGKTNAPELGLGSHTYNRRWGITRNAYDPNKSAGGSSGGAAAALATRMLAIADGSDMMGSLRNPAGWNNLYSHRPTAGIIEDNSPPNPTNPLPYPISTVGPMARSPLDLALLLEVMATPKSFNAAEVADKPSVEGMRIAWLGNAIDYPVENGILNLCRSALHSFSDIGVTIDDLNDPVFDSQELWKSWTTIRSKIVSTSFPLPAPLLRLLLPLIPVREELKWEVQRGLNISEGECAEAAKIAATWSKHLEEVLFEKYDALALPTAQTWAFPAEWKFPQEIGGKHMDTYHRWMEIVLPGSLAGLPCTTIPAGFAEDDEGRRTNRCMGIQLLGKRESDAKLLNIAQAYHGVADWPSAVQPPLVV